MEKSRGGISWTDLGHQPTLIQTLSHEMEMTWELAGGEGGSGPSN